MAGFVLRRLTRLVNQLRRDLSAEYYRPFIIACLLHHASGCGQILADSITSRLYNLAIRI